MLNDAAAKSGSVAFRFNTYIISVLVIFYLQLNYNLPRVSELSNKVLFSPKEEFGQIVRGFFKFYGKHFECNNHLISINIGKWQEKKIQKSQQHFSSEQQRFVAL